jgi:hypothetical protein
MLNKRPVSDDLDIRLTVIVPTQSAAQARAVAESARGFRYNLECSTEEVGGQHRTIAKFATPEHARRFEESLRGRFQAYRPMLAEDVFGSVGRVVEVTVKGGIYPFASAYPGLLERVDDEHVRLLSDSAAPIRTVRVDQIVDLRPL